MKRMIRQANDRTLILIDEFGTGTEPQIGGAIAQAVLEQFWKRQAWAVITTHYQNLKHFAEDHPGVANGAMLYDRHEMRPLFQLAIGRPGSSFAIEIARKIGLPEEVIREASEIVGSDYIQSDKYLQDIVRDKRYWEAKRQTVHAREKELEKRLEKYESMVEDVEKSRKEILARARAQAEELIKESNKRIENTIREIREHQAEKEETRKIRQQLAEFERGLDKETPAPSKEKRAKGHGVMSDEDFQAKVERIRSRKERHEKRQAEKASQQKKQAEMRPTVQRELPIDKGDTVRIKGLTSTGTVEKPGRQDGNGRLRRRHADEDAPRPPGARTGAEGQRLHGQHEDLPGQPPDLRADEQHHAEHGRCPRQAFPHGDRPARHAGRRGADAGAILHRRRHPGRCFPGAHPPRQGQRHPAPNDPPVSCHRAQRPVLPRRARAVWRSRHHRRGTVIAGAN